MEDDIILLVDALRNICKLNLKTVTFPLSEQSACKVVHTICNLIDEKVCKELLPWPLTDSQLRVQFRLGVRKFTVYINKEWNANVIIINPIAIATPASPKFLTYLYSLCLFAMKFITRQKYDNYRRPDLSKRTPNEKHILLNKYFDNKMVEIATLATNIPKISLEDKEKEKAELINTNKIIEDKLKSCESKCPPHVWAKIIEGYQNASAALKEWDASLGSNSVYQDFEDVLKFLKFIPLNSLDGDIILSQFSQDMWQKLEQDFQVQIVSNGKLCFNGYLQAVISVLKKIVEGFENAKISDQLLAEIKANELNLDIMHKTLFESIELLKKQIETVKKDVDILYKELEEDIKNAPPAPRFLVNLCQPIDFKIPEPRPRVFEPLPDAKVLFEQFMKRHGKNNEVQKIEERFENLGVSTPLYHTRKQNPKTPSCFASNGPLNVSLFGELSSIADVPASSSVDITERTDSTLDVYPVQGPSCVNVTERTKSEQPILKKSRPSIQNLLNRFNSLRENILND